MKAYKDVITLIKETKTFASYITKLGKIKATTEDEKLIEHLHAVITKLQRSHIISTSKSTPICLNNSTERSVNVLAQYCLQIIGNQKSEWQIVAERNNWGPKI